MCGLHERPSGDCGGLGGWQDRTALHLPLVIRPGCVQGMTAVESGLITPQESFNSGQGFGSPLRRGRGARRSPRPPLWTCQKRLVPRQLRKPTCQKRLTPPSAREPGTSATHQNGVAQARSLPGPRLRISGLHRSSNGSVLLSLAVSSLGWAGAAAGAGMACNAAAEVAELRGSQAVLVTVLEWCDLNSLGHVLRRRSARLAGGPLDFDQSYVRGRPPSRAAPDPLTRNRRRSCLQTPGLVQPGGMSKCFLISPCG